MLAKASRLAKVEVDELLRLNPGFNHATVSNETPQRILVPVNAFDQFTRELAALPTIERVQWQHYKVGKGDTLTSIARKFDIAPSVLASANDLSDKRLKPSQELLIPEGGTASALEIAQAAPAAGHHANPVWFDPDISYR